MRNETPIRQAPPAHDTLPVPAPLPASVQDVAERMLDYAVDHEQPLRHICRAVGILADQGDEGAQMLRLRLMSDLFGADAMVIRADSIAAA